MSGNKTKITIYDFSYKLDFLTTPTSLQPPSFTLLYLTTKKKVYYLCIKFPLTYPTLWLLWRYIMVKVGPTCGSIVLYGFK